MSTPSILPISSGIDIFEEKHVSFSLFCFFQCMFVNLYYLLFFLFNRRAEIESFTLMKNNCISIWDIYTYLCFYGKMKSKMLFFLLSLSLFFYCAVVVFRWFRNYLFLSMSLLFFRYFWIHLFVYLLFLLSYLLLMFSNWNIYIGRKRKKDKRNKHYTYVFIYKR